MAEGQLGTKMFRRETEQKHLHLVAIYNWMVTGMKFRAQDQFLETVDTFKYLDRMLLYDDIDCPSVANYLHRSHRK